jgi:Na+-driven multidrug efflux pump
MNTLSIRTTNSLKRINWRLYLALLVTAAFPTIYTTTRIYFLGDLPAAWGVNIASQLAWVNLGLEVVQEAIILPLFYILGKSLSDRDATLNKLKSGLAVTFGIYAVCTSLIALFAEPLVRSMAQNTEQIPATVAYIRLEMIASTLASAVRFLTIFFVLRDWRRAIYGVLGIQVFVSVLLDAVLLSQLDFSFQLGVNGIAFSNIAASVVTLAYALWFLKNEYRVTRADWNIKLDFTWMREWWSVGKWSGADSLIRNAFFLIFIIRMINVVEEQGTFWVANSFIWSWLLLPFLPLADLVKQDTAQGDRMPHWDKMLGYFTACIIFSLAWVALAPGFGWFFENVFNTDPTPHVALVLLSLPFYMFFMFNTTMDSVLAGRGKTAYLALQSLITNVGVYGTVYVLYRLGIVQPTLQGIAILFGTGIVVDTFVTWWLYNRHLKQSGYVI